MPFYDPTRCPDCRSALPVPPTRCESCDLPLTGQVALQLQATLRYADQLVTRLRHPMDLPAHPAPTSSPRARERRPASVPAVLLGLGALCLLVAATVFLAVAWSWLGVGGRTVVLAGLTATAAGAGLWLGRRGLRVAAESFTVVALGLVLLDVAGAARSGWLGDHPGGLPPGAYGAALAAAALLLLVLPARLLARRPVVPALAAPAGLLVLVADRAAESGHARLVLVGGVLALALLAGTGRRLGTRVLAWGAAGAAAASWLALLGLGLLDAIAEPSLSGLWRDGDAAALLTATVLLALPVLAGRGRRAVLDPCLAVAASLLTLLAVLPALDGPADPAWLAVAGAGAVWAMLTVLVPRRWITVTAAPTVLLALPLGLVALVQGLAAVTRVFEVGAPFARDLLVRLAPAPTSGPHPVLLPVAVLVVLGTGLVLLPAPERRAAAPWAAVPTALAVVAALALAPVPLGVVVAGLAATGLTLALLSREGAVLAGLVGLGLLATAVTAALPSAVLACGAAAVLAAAATSLILRARPVARTVGGATLPLALAVAGWAGGDATGLEPSYRSLVVLLLLGALAIARPRVELESAAALAAVAVSAAGIDGSTSLAVHLTLVGALTTTTALVHPGRRPLGWAGGLLLAAATWVRLGDVGVSVPEPYTLPTAVALLLVGLHRLTRDRDADTATTLLPGLALATVPSLLWVLADPVSPRAVLLGGVCLALVLLGAQLRWGAPLVVGAVVGATLVLREAAPYLAQTPQWILIGTAGALLTVVGISWERRVVELRRAGSYVEGLR
jgi:hypothetical protein